MNFRIKKHHVIYGCIFIIFQRPDPFFFSIFKIFCHLKGGLKVEMPMNLKVSLEHFGSRLKSLRIKSLTICVCGKSLQSCPTLCNLMDCSPWSSSVHRIFQARILEWVAISFSRVSSWPRDWTPISCISCIGRQIIYHWATQEAQGNNANTSVIDVC